MNSLEQLQTQKKRFSIPFKIKSIKPGFLLLNQTFILMIYFLLQKDTVCSCGQIEYIFTTICNAHPTFFSLMTVTA